MSDNSANRQFAIGTPLPPGDLKLQSATIREGISSLSEATVSLLSGSERIPHEKVLGKNMTIRIDRPGQEMRYFNGYATDFVKHGQWGRDEGVLYTATLRPWAWFLTQKTNHRQFLGKNVLEIVRQILKDHKLELLDDSELRSKGDYRAIEYCVQYQETDFNFISRLLEQEGIYYVFRHENGKHTMVLCDHPTSHSFEKGYEKIPYLAPAEMRAANIEERVWEWSEEHAVHPVKAILRDFNFEKPAFDLTATQSKAEDFSVGDMSTYEFAPGYGDAAAGARIAKRRMEMYQAAQREFSGSGDTRGIHVGRKFDLHRNQSSGPRIGTYLVTATTIRIENPAEQSAGGSGTPYSCSFAAVPADTQFRPVRRTPKPRVLGPQTAIVVSDTKGAEIDPDEFGRVKVRFHWEREEKNSTWIRVAQAWAGSRWGAMFHPRVGQEVVVEFLEGDPDRPLITGCIYNGANRNPYDPKQKPTVSSIKSQSSKGGGGFNEIRFDDEKGKEDFLLHASKDMNVYVRDDLLTYVADNQHEIVRKDSFSEIKANQHVAVGADRNETVGDSYSLKVAADWLSDVGTAFVLKSGNEVHIKAGAKIVLEASTEVSIKVGGTFIKLDPSGVTIVGPMVKINSGGSAGSGSGTAPEKPKAAVKAWAPGAGAALSAPKTRSVPPTPAQLSRHPVAARQIQAAKQRRPFQDIC